MISRRIACQPKNDHYRRLALYIAGAGHKGEKLLANWCAGAWSEDDYGLAIEEVELVQATNVRTTREKTYHLLVSFRPEDEGKLTPAVLRAIETEFARALGLAEHQRHAGVHINTNNLHLHVAYNLIHPDRRTRHEPFRDFWIRDRVCRELERRYGLTIDQGRQPNQPATGPDSAMAFEAHTGQESFFSYARRQLESLRTDLAQAQSWPEAHRAFGKYGLTLKLHGNGLVVQDLSGHQAIKASALDRDFSKARLEKRFGSFQVPGQDLAVSKPRTTYSAAPLQVEANRGKLYDEYLAAREKRRAGLEQIKAQEGRILEINRRQWEKQITEIRRLPMLRRHRRETMEQFRKKKSAELVNLRQQMKLKREQVRTAYPFNSWSQFLQDRAGRGQEEALAVLRSRKMKVGPERPAAGQSQTNLSSIARMKEILGSGPGPAWKYRLDNQGTAIFYLPGGGVIRDSGAVIHFRPGDGKARTIAEKLARAKWGETVSLAGNTLRPGSARSVELNRIPSSTPELAR
jgi:hypothetical protein